MWRTSAKKEHRKTKNYMRVEDEFGNPWLTSDSFSQGKGKMTLHGTVIKYFVYMAIMVIVAYFQMGQSYKAVDAAGIDRSKIERVTYMDEDNEEATKLVYVTTGLDGERIEGPLPEIDYGKVIPLMWFGLLAGFCIAMVTIGGPKISPFTTPFYAICEGLCLGGLCGLYELEFQGITVQAFLLTAGVQMLMLVVYATGIIKVTGGFASAIFGILTAILLVYFTDLGLHLFVGGEVPYLNEPSPIGLAINGAICIVAALCFLIDFKAIDDGLEYGAAKYYEDYCAFSMLVTFVWLFLEIFKWILKFKQSDQIRSLNGGWDREAESATS